jgi:hypothetical protein
MKIIVDISAEDFENVKCGRGAVSVMRKAIIHGIPLDKIRAEIDEQYDRVPPWGAEGLEMALEIIDKYNAESEDKE